MRKKYTTETLIQAARAIHGDIYDYSKSVYSGIDARVTIICNVHGEFQQSPYSHVNKKRGCARCSSKETARKRNGKDLQYYLTKAKAKHGDRYDYSLAVYRGCEEPIIIVCPVHGEFQQTPYLHARGHGCVRCAQSGERRRGRLPGFVGAGGGGRKPWTTETFLKSAQRVHGDRYDYSEVEYSDKTTPVTIICLFHGRFQQIPTVHVNSRAGCPTCGVEQRAEKRRKGVDQFIEDARAVHGLVYSYDETVYVNDTTKVEILCPKHGPFWQKPSNHIHGRNGCPKCVGSVSKASQDWLDSMGVPDTPETREVYGLIPNSRIVVDGFDPETNRVYEFWGDFHHGNPNVYDLDEINPKYNVPFRILFESTMEKREKIIENGYTLVEIWESEWKTCVSSVSIPESQED